MKRLVSLLLIFVFLVGFIPIGTFRANAATTLTLAQLREKFPHGKYWNHVGNPGYDNNNQDGYTSTPCPKHGNLYSSSQTCNGFAPNGRQLSWQCMGFAEKLGYDATGYNPRNDEGGWRTYTSVSALDNLKPGDIVRYDNHSIYVTAVNGETVTFTDCNYTAKCYIRWDATISMSKLRSSFRYLQSAPFAMTSEPVDCGCSEEYAGTYKCTTVTSYLNIRGGHSTSYSIVGSIPPGGVVTVTEASGTSSSDWAHVEYNGVSGYSSMQYLQKQEEQEEEALFDIPGVTMSLGNDLAMYFYVPVANVTDGCYAEITKTYADGRADLVKTVSINDCSVSGEYYLVGFDGIAAKEMTDVLSATVYAADGVQISSVKETSVEAYALGMLKEATNAELRTVLADMLNYGAQAQNEFSYNISDLANADMTETHKSYATAQIDMSALDDHVVKGAGWAARSLTLKSNIQLSIFFDTGVVTKDMTAKISYKGHNGTSVSYEIPGSSFQVYDATHLYLNIETLVAADLETVVSIDIYDGGTLVSESEYNMAEYCKAFSSDAMLIQLSKFCTAAYAYFH